MSVAELTEALGLRAIGVDWHVQVSACSVNQAQQIAQRSDAVPITSQHRCFRANFAFAPHTMIAAALVHRCLTMLSCKRRRLAR